MAFTQTPTIKATGGGFAKWAPVATGALAALSNVWSSNKEGNRQQALTREQLAYARQRDDADRSQRWGEQALKAASSDPLNQQKSRQLNALVSSMLSGYKPSTMDDPSSGLNLKPEQYASFFTPEARANAENAFNANARTASGGQYTAQTGVGYGGAGAPASATPGALGAGARMGESDPEDWSWGGDLSRPSDKRGVGILGGVASGASTGATLGSVIPGIGTAIGAGVGAAVGGIGGWLGGQSNDTKENRETLARNLGYGSINGLNNALNALGPEGQRLVDIGLNRIGRKDAAAQAEWDRQVQRLLSTRPGGFGGG